MLVYRNLIGVSAASLLILSLTLTAKAQESKPDVNPSLGENTKESLPQNPAGVENNQQQQQGVQAPNNQTNSPRIPAPEVVNPSSNPFEFPTLPSEVKTNLTPITLDQAIETAIRNNKQLQGARVALQRSQAQLDEAIGAQFPSLDLSGDFQYGKSSQTELSNQQLFQTYLNNRELYRQNPAFFREFPTFNPTNEISTTIQPSIELSYLIYSGGRIGANVNRSEKQVRRDQLEVEVTLEDTRFNASRDYFALQNADAQVAISQAQVEDATQTLRDAQLLEQAGLGTRFDVLQAEVQLANANQTLTRSISDQRSARSQLAQTLSIAQDVQLTAADEIKEVGQWSLPLEDSVVLAYKNRAELEQQLLDREIGEQDRIVALANRAPQITLFANYNVFDNFNDSFQVTDGYAFGARLRWNLFDGGQAQARARQAESNIALAEVRFGDQRDRIRLQVEQAYYDLVANKDNITTAQKSIETARESLRLARLRFQAGVGTQTDVINSQTELTTARGNYLRAIIGYNQALNTLQRAVSNYPDNLLFKKP